jgi:hypothetical protein
MRLEVIRRILSILPYEGRDQSVATPPDPNIIGSGFEFLRPVPAAG